MKLASWRLKQWSRWKNYDVEKLRTLALGIVVNNQVGSVEFLDLSGNLVLAIRQKQAGDNREYVYVSGGAPIFGDWPIVQKVLSGQYDNAGNKFASFVKTDWGDYFYVSGPIKAASGNLAGVILIGMPLSSVVRELRSATLAQVTLYDFTGHVIITTFPESTTIQPLETSLTQKILAQQDSESYRRDSSQRELQSSGLNYGEIMGPWEARDGQDLGLLGTAMAKNALITASLPTRAWIAVLVFLTGMLVVLIGLNLSTRLTRPLLKLMQASKSVALGNLDIQVPHESNDEIAILASSFNTMVQNLQQSHEEMIETYDNTLEGWAKALELRDKETSGHTVRVTDLMAILAHKIGVSEEQLVHIRRGTMLHDIGKMGIPDHILLKPGPLTDEEWAIMRLHPIYAYEMLKNIPYLVPALDIPYGHHERWDGRGYPRQLKGEGIPLAARLFSIVDTWDALTIDRPYHKRITPLEAVRIIRGESGKQFDPALVEVFCGFMDTLLTEPT
jgi:HAMP domain-containing protein